MSTQLDERTDTTTVTETENDKPLLAHIIDRGNDSRPAGAIVLEAHVLGLTLTALCGYTWVPCRNPEDLDVCPKCLEMYAFAKDFRS